MFNFTHTHLLLWFIIILVIMPSKKYLNRDRKKRKLSAEDEWAHLAGIEEGPKLDTSDALDVQSRDIFIRGTKPKHQSMTELVQDEILDAGFKVRTTDQYVKLVNAIFDSRLAEIERIKKQKQMFDEDVEGLRSEGESDFEKLRKIPIKKLKSTDVAKLITAISNEKINTQTKLEHHKSKATTLENQIEDQERKIKELDTKLKEKISQEKDTKEKNSVEDVHDELKVLGELYGLDKLSKALKILKDSQGEK